MNTFTYHTEEDEENSLMKLEAPGRLLLIHVVSVL